MRSFSIRTASTRSKTWVAATAPMSTGSRFTTPPSSTRATASRSASTSSSTPAPPRAIPTASLSPCRRPGPRPSRVRPAATPPSVPVAPPRPRHPQVTPGQSPHQASPIRSPTLRLTHRHPHPHPHLPRPHRHRPPHPRPAQARSPWSTAQAARRLISSSYALNWLRPVRGWRCASSRPSARLPRCVPLWLRWSGASHPCWRRCAPPLPKRRLPRVRARVREMSPASQLARAL